MSYARYTAILAISTVVMFGLMYLIGFALDHLTFSETRIWMALLMGAAMTIVMTVFMWSMYRNKPAHSLLWA